MNDLLQRKETILFLNNKGIKYYLENFFYLPSIQDYKIYIGKTTAYNFAILAGAH